ncbi:MAG: hypothetical protein KDC92_03920 [Bacteroidetes bacterium]|nr:hypothetical protein [Bacteroidota bacterium]
MELSLNNNELIFDNSQNLDFHLKIYSGNGQLIANEQITGLTQAIILEDDGDEWYLTISGKNFASATKLSRQNTGVILASD